MGPHADGVRPHRLLDSFRETGILEYDLRLAVAIRHSRRRSARPSLTTWTRLFR
jgi:hypothetical protein